jgi:hypothetical protein
LDLLTLDSKIYEKNTHYVEKPSPKECCAVSWRWVANKGKDIDQTVADITSALLDSNIRYAWVDRCCLPQESFDISSVLKASVVYDSGKVMIMSLSPNFDKKFTYVNRLWTSVEVYRSLCRNPVNMGIGSLCPDTFEMRKVKMLFNFLVDLHKRGGGYVYDLKSNGYNFEQISLLLRKKSKVKIQI